MHVYICTCKYTGKQSFLSEREEMPHFSNLCGPEIHILINNERGESSVIL